LVGLPARRSGAAVPLGLRGRRRAGSRRSRRRATTSATATVLAVVRVRCAFRCLCSGGSATAARILVFRRKRLGIQARASLAVRNTGRDDRRAEQQEEERERSTKHAHRITREDTKQGRFHRPFDGITWFSHVTLVPPCAGLRPKPCRSLRRYGAPHRERYVGRGMTLA
jgi:hypothetical protein